MTLAQIGLIGLGPMGKGFALNLADHDYRTCVFNRHGEVTERFIQAAQEEPKGKNLFPAYTLEELVGKLERPRKILLFIKAGPPVDEVIEKLIPLLDRGDLIVDCSNAHHRDAKRREQWLKRCGLRFVGSGVSGGEAGARFGPSLMAGGHEEGWKLIEEIWRSVAAKVDPSTHEPLTGAEPGFPLEGGEPCADYFGANGAGHFIKTVHNGIEYAVMQLIAESFWLLKKGLGLENGRIAELFRQWNGGPLGSFLLKIASETIAQPDPRGEGELVDKILDVAEQKGTGKWTVEAALNFGVPVPTIAAAVFARDLSARKEERLQAETLYATPTEPIPPETVPLLERALHLGILVSYAQGFALLEEAKRQEGWKFSLERVARIWRGGCILQGKLLHLMMHAYQEEPALPNLLLSRTFAKTVRENLEPLRQVVASAQLAGLPVPAFSSALSYLDSYRSGHLPMNLIQAMRDRFGAHAYERTDDEGRFHFDWQGSEREERLE